MKDKTNGTHLTPPPQIPDEIYDPPPTHALRAFYFRPRVHQTRKVSGPPPTRIYPAHLRPKLEQKHTLSGTIIIISIIISKQHFAIANVLTVSHVTS